MVTLGMAALTPGTELCGPIAHAQQVPLLHKLNDAWLDNLTRRTQLEKPKVV